MPYVEGKMTVLCNGTIGILNTNIRDPRGGKGGVVLDKGEFFDVEEWLTKEQIRHYLRDFESWEAQGLIRWFPKGKNPDIKDALPKPSFVPNPVGVTEAPLNPFDFKLDALIDAEKERDKRTESGDLRRTAPSTIAHTPATDITDAADERAKRIKEEAEKKANEEIALKGKELDDLKRELDERQESIELKEKEQKEKDEDSFAGIGKRRGRPRKDKDKNSATAESGDK